MNSTLTAGTRIVVLALASYTVAIISEQTKKIITNIVLIFLTLGIALDISATSLMIIGSPNSPFTIHGVLGYSALAGMMIDTILIWRYFSLKRREKVPAKLHLYSRFAYLWWVIAFVTGSLMVIFK